MIPAVLALFLVACSSSVRTPPANLAELSKKQNELEKTVEELQQKLIIIEGKLDAVQAGPVSADPIAPPVKMMKPTPHPSSFLGVGEGPSEPSKLKLTNEDLMAFNRRREQEISKAYRDAYRLFEEKKFDACIARMQAFSAKYPDHALAGNALYWSGESYFEQKKFDLALSQFSSVFEQHSKSAKASDALMKIGATYKELGKIDKARENFALTVKKFPRSEAAKRAKVELNKLEGEGKGQ